MILGTEEHENSTKHLGHQDGQVSWKAFTLSRENMSPAWFSSVNYISQDEIRFGPCG